MTPRVTVLLAAYNGGAYLREAVDSVLAQTYLDFELLIVDDASTDGATETLPHDERIRILRNEHNIGQIPSLNRGLREANGEYVARLDHDDVCLPSRLQLQVDLLDASPEVALAGSWVDVVDVGGRLWAPLRPQIESFADFVCQVVTGDVYLVHPSITFRRRIVVDLGGFDESLHAAEDQDLYRKLVLGRHSAGVVQEVLLRYRRHEQQMTMKKPAAVLASDDRSYDRFLDALAPETPTRSLRLMLRGHSAFWRERPLHEGDLDRFLASATTRLELDPQGQRRLAYALARRAGGTLLAGWAGDSRSSDFHARSRPLVAFIRRHGATRTRVVASATPFLLASAEVGVMVGSVRTRLTQALRSDALKNLRSAARRSRTLRRIYTHVADTRREH